MSERFKRIIRVTVSTRPDPTEPRKFFQRYTQARVIEDLRVVFNVEKNTEKQSNKATVKIYNLAKKTRAEFQTKPAHVHLEAGYESTGFSTLYKGDIFHARSYQEKTEWVTELDCGSGSYFSRFGRVSIGLKKGSDPVEFAKSLAKSVGLEIPKNLDEAKGFLGKITTGMTVDGKALDEINKLVKVNGGGYTASIQDDKLVLVREGDVLKAESIVVSTATGMIGSPELGTPEKKGQRPTLNVSMLLNPNVVPRTLISVSSNSVNGVFLTERVMHKGDTHGMDWTTTMEAKSRG